MSDDPDGIGLEIEWFRTRYRFVPGRPSPFLPSERRLVEIVVRVLDRRFHRAPLGPVRGAPGKTFFQHYATEGTSLPSLRLPRRPGPRAHPDGAGGAAGRRSLHLREPAGLDRRDPARDRARPVGPRPRERPRGAEVRVEPVGDQEHPPDLRRPADGLPRRPSGGPRLAGRRRPVGRPGAGAGPPRDARPAPFPVPRPGDAVGRARRPGADAGAGDPGLRRRDDGVYLQRRSLAPARHRLEVRLVVRGPGPDPAARPGA